MFSQFGHKWLCLHRGPAWQYEMAVDPIELDASVNCGNSLVERTLQESGLDLNTYNEDVDDLNSLSEIFELSLSSDLGCDQSLAEESTSTDCLSVVTPNTYASSENGSSLAAGINQHLVGPIQAQTNSMSYNLEVPPQLKWKSTIRLSH